MKECCTSRYCCLQASPPESLPPAIAEKEHFQFPAPMPFISSPPPTWNDTLPDPAVPLGTSFPVLPLNVGGGLPGALLLCQGTSSPTSSPMASRKSSSQMMQSQKVRR